MVLFNYEITDVFFNQLLEFLTICGLIFGGLKYIDSRQNNKIKEEVEKQIDLVMAKLTDQVTRMADCLEKQTEQTKIHLDYIRDAIEHFQRVEEINNKGSPIK